MVSPKCKISIPCTANTPYGAVHGKKCQLGQTVNHLGSIKNVGKILEAGWINPSPEVKVVSMSSCPTQKFGGNIRLILSATALKDQLKPMCYWNTTRIRQIPKGSQERDAVHAMEGELNPDGSQPSPNEIRARHASSTDVYAKECEYQSRKPISTDAIRRIEYWIGGSYPKETSLGCKNRFPHITGSGATVEDYIADIQKTKAMAAKQGVSFSIKTCFNKMQAGWDKFFELNKENIQKLKDGIVPETFSAFSAMNDEVQETCTC